MAHLRSRLALDASWFVHDLTPARFRPEPPAAEADPDAPATILTCVAPLPAPLAAGLGLLSRDLEQRDPSHRFYPPESMHLTLAHSPPADRAAGAVADVEEVAAAIAGCRVAVVGLGIGPSTVFALLEADDARLVRARTMLRCRWKQGVAARASWFLVAPVLHATIVRFRSRPSAELVDLVRRRRLRRSGSYRLESLQLVRTNKVMARGRTTVVLDVPVAR